MKKLTEEQREDLMEWVEAFAGFGCLFMIVFMLAGIGG